VKPYPLFIFGDLYTILLLQEILSGKYLMMMHVNISFSVSSSLSECIGKQ